METLERDILSWQFYDEWQKPCSDLEPFLKRSGHAPDEWVVMDRPFHAVTLLPKVVCSPCREPLVQQPLSGSVANVPGLRSDYGAASYADEQQWIEEHSQEFAGRWVALQGTSLLAAGESAKSVYQRALELGVRRPLVIRIEPPGLPPFGGW